MVVEKWKAAVKLPMDYRDYVTKLCPTAPARRQNKREPRLKCLRQHVPSLGRMHLSVCFVVGFEPTVIMCNYYFVQNVWYIF